MIRKAKMDHLIAIGLDPKDAEDWHKKYSYLRLNSKGKREFKLTFEEYISLAVEAGLTSPSQIGLESHKYQMGRIGDQGGYTWGNCRFITGLENKRELAMFRKKQNPFTYVIHSPSGEKFNTDNLSRFCKEHGLNQGNMCSLNSGRLKYYKGWKIKQGD